MLWRGVVVPPDPDRRPRARRSATRFSRAKRRRRGGHRRSIFSATTIGRDGRASSSPIARATPCRGRPRRFPPSRRSSSPPSRPMARGRSDLGVVYASTGAALTPVATAPGAGQYAVSAGVYSFSAADAGQRGRAFLRLRATGRRAGGARARGRALPRRRAHRPQVEVRRRPGDDRLRLDARSQLRFSRCCNRTSGWRSDVRDRPRGPQRDERTPRSLAGCARRRARGEGLRALGRARRPRQERQAHGRSPERALGRAQGFNHGRGLHDRRRRSRLRRLVRRRQIRRDRGIRREDRRTRDSSHQGAGAGLRCRRGRALRPEGRASRVGDAGAVVPALLARGDERRDRFIARRGGCGSWSRA